MEIRLSYIMTTFNKLSYLKVTLPYLIANRKSDEEIVIVDGGSTDGTKEFLQEQLHQKNIQQFISEKDFGEAHGTNKALLLAKGILLKIVTDDDVFDFDVISACKDYMLKQQDIDICGTDGLGISSIHKNDGIILTNYVDGFLEWKNSKSPFLFCGLSYMIRKSSISKLGLLSTQFKIIDLEYSVRVSAMRANIAFCNAYSFVNVVGADSNSNKFYDSIRDEKRLLKKLYPTISNLNYYNNFSAVVKHKIKKLTKIKSIVEPNKNNGTQNYMDLIKYSVNALKDKNKSVTISFL